MRVNSHVSHMDPGHSAVPSQLRINSQPMIEQAVIQVEDDDRYEDSY